MFRHRKSSACHHPEAPVSPALEMALSVRLRIFARADIEPATAAFLEAFTDRLDGVRASRHSVDFETAKALAWWQGVETDRLVALACTEIENDPEIQRLKSVDDLEAIVLDRHVEERVRALIRDGQDDLALRLTLLSKTRLNVQ